MEENKKLEETTTPVVEEKTVAPTVEEKSKKNSVKLMFAILGGLVFMLLIIASVFFLVPFINGNGTKVTKTGVDVKDVKSEYRMSSNSLEKFDLSFLKLENKEANKIYSPLSIKYTLAMLSEGSNGMSKAQIDAVIGEYQSKKYNNNEHMSFANVMFLRNTLKDTLKEDYKSALKTKYDADVILNEFTSAAPMNNLINSKTLGLINNLLDDDAVKQEDFELINALAIDMNWNNQIQCATGSSVPCQSYDVYYRHEKYKTDRMYSSSVATITSEDGFYPLTFNGKENVKSATIKASFNRYDIVKTLGEEKITEEVGKAYREWLETEDGKNNLKYGYADEDVNKFLAEYIEELNSNYGKSAASTDFMLYKDDNVKVFAKNLQEYEGTTLQYVAIMPTSQSLTNYVENVTPEDLNNIISNLKDMNKENFTDGVVTLIRGRIPMFKYDYTLDLMKDLKNLGITDVFDSSKADLSGMLEKSSGEYISSAKHKATIEFSNDGIKAAAVTGMGGTGSTGAGFDYFFKIPVEEIDLTFDKPFMYIIRDKDTGEVWFTGTVYEGQQRPVAKMAESEWSKTAWENFE